MACDVPVWLDGVRLAGLLHASADGDAEPVGPADTVMKVPSAKSDEETARAPKIDVLLCWPNVEAAVDVLFLMRTCVIDD